MRGDSSSADTTCENLFAYLAVAVVAAALARRRRRRQRRRRRRRRRRRQRRRQRWRRRRRRCETKPPRRRSIRRPKDGGEQRASTNRRRRRGGAAMRAVRSAIGAAPTEGAAPRPAAGGLRRVRPLHVDDHLLSRRPNGFSVTLVRRAAPRRPLIRHRLLRHCVCECVSVSACVCVCVASLSSETVAETPSCPVLEFSSTTATVATQVPKISPSKAEIMTEQQPLSKNRSKDQPPLCSSENPFGGARFRSPDYQTNSLAITDAGAEIMETETDREPMLSARARSRRRRRH